MKNLESVKQLVNGELLERYTEDERIADTLDRTFSTLLHEMQVFISRGGKRLRPFLAYCAYTGLGGKDENTIIKIGSAIEQFHNYLLIHDDIIDRDTIRYGGPTIEGVYLAKLHALNARDPEHGAMSTALLAGDITAALSRKTIYSLPIEEAKKLSILHAFDEATFLVGYGEFADSLAGALSHKPLTIEQIQSVYVHKTALYSFYLPLQIGAIAAGASDEIIEQLKEFAIELGVAFQIRDDYLGLFGDTEVTGKPITSDVREGKQTMYYALVREKLSPEDLETLSLHYGNPHADEDAVEVVRELFRKSGVVKELGEKVDAMRAKAKAIVSGIPFAPEVMQEIIEIIDYCTKRDE